ncbi:hypothetical protein YYC_02790 [Plasmodium yoelii 17X]|uniref:YIR protein n=1 Tax=Plasmodium yoelii 17X TaxID=1323249 RepID=V7PNH6_PLAYE|nr:hypothetical protein YYC_02790 [Plasmodium yoelii 17X]
MNDRACRILLSVKNSISDKLDKNQDYQFIIESNFNKYCTNGKCSNNLGKIDAGCLYLFDAFFESSSVFESVAKSNTNIVDYIMIWLSYMLNLKEQIGNETNLQYFYKTFINNDKYKKPITGVEKYYENYKDLIDKKKYFWDLDSNIISNFYKALILLCEMYTNFDEKSSFCSICSQNAKKFVNIYKEINQNNNITSDSSYNKILSILENDYNNFKKYCNTKGGKCEEYPTLPTIENIRSSGQFSEDTSSSSSITSKLFTVLSIFGAIAFFLGISYKYSLFGFRKRFQKQKLREKLKNIKKRMNH